VEHLEKVALESSQHKSLLWLCYVDDKFVAWPHGPEQLLNFLSHLNSLRPSIQFTKEMDPYSAFPFFGVLVIRKKTPMATKVFRKPTHTGQYLNVNSNHPPHVKRFNSVFTKEIPPHAKNIKICVITPVVSDVIFSFTVIFKISLTQLLTPRAAVL
jgi:hypothetical protein